MLKALLMASVIIGAFLFQPVKANVNLERCPLGGTYQEIDGIHMCTEPAPSGVMYTAQNAYAAAKKTTKAAACDANGELAAPLVQAEIARAVSGTHSTSYLGHVIVNDNLCRLTMFTNSTRLDNSAYSSTTYVDTTILTGPPEYYCPPDDTPSGLFLNFYPVEPEGGICWHPANDPSNDNECPPGTVGDCDEPPEEPQCSIAGNGMEVCPADPDEKCTSYQQDGQTYYDCPTNCGFINDQFFCTSDPDIPDIPDMSDCFKVATGYACPSDSPDPDDNIDNPNKPLPDMTKGDFKETNKGIETRLNATNKLLGDLTGIGAANNQALADLNAKQLAANGFLRNIAQNTADTAKNTGDIKDALTGDGLDLDDNHRGLIGGALGITGDESIDELTKEEITLDSFRSEFQWSGGGGSCPPPRQITIIRNTFTMDWQPFCEAFSVLSYFILAAAYFFAGLIAFGGRQ